MALINFYFLVCLVSNDLDIADPVLFLYYYIKSSVRHAPRHTVAELTDCSAFIVSGSVWKVVRVLSLFFAIYISILSSVEIWMIYNHI